jgi:hypothetical protein
MRSRDADALRSYLKGVEPIRLGVNQLLEGADPILAGYRDHHLSGSQAATAMSDLEHKFADYTVAMAAIQPSATALAQMNAPYAHTYVLEDAYLSALVVRPARWEIRRSAEHPKRAARCDHRVAD